MNKTYEKINNYIEEHNLISDGSTLIVGLSGGPDSVFLLEYLHQVSSARNLTLIGAHLDHEWRENSWQDTLFCEDLCQKLGIQFISAKASTLDYKPKKTGSLEELGRNLRRHFLLDVCRKKNAQAIALGHHADDQQETFFIRLVRGTALAGLCGMQPEAGKFIRPLLTTYKNEILDILDANNTRYLIDPTNEQTDFLRNRIRKLVIPALRETDARFDKNFLSTLNHLQDAEDTLSALTQAMYQDITTVQDGSTQLDTEKLKAMTPYLRNRILLYWLISENIIFTPTEKFLAEIVRFIEQPENKDHELHTTWRLRKKKNKVWIVFN